MEEIGELLGFRIAGVIGEERPGVDEPDARVTLHGLGDEHVELLDLLGRALLVGGTREHLADDDRRPWVLRFDRRDDRLHVGGNRLRLCSLFEVVGPHEHDDA